MSAEISGGYPFIGGVTGERGGVQNNPTIDSAYFVTPTTNFSTYMQAASIGVGYAPGGKLVNKANGAQYAIPIYLNA